MAFLLLSRLQRGEVVCGAMPHLFNDAFLTSQMLLSASCFFCFSSCCLPTPDPCALVCLFVSGLSRGRPLSSQSSEKEGCPKLWTSLSLEWITPIVWQSFTLKIHHWHLLHPFPPWYFHLLIKSNEVISWWLPVPRARPTMFDIWGSSLISFAGFLGNSHHHHGEWRKVILVGFGEKNGFACH